MNTRCPCRHYHQEPTSHEVGMESLRMSKLQTPNFSWVLNAAERIQPFQRFAREDVKTVKEYRYPLAVTGLKSRCQQECFGDLWQA